MTQSHEIPERVIVKDKIEYRVNVQEVVIEGNTSYTYDTLAFPIGTPTEVCERKVAKYLISVGNIDEAKFALANAYGDADNIQARLETYEEYQTYKDSIKKDTLDKLTVTTTSGKVFYADTEARIDLQSAIDGANLKGLTSTYWKLAEEFEGSRIVGVSLDEIREAGALALEAKAGLVGVTNA
jgi:hypothetical protein